VAERVAGLGGVFFRSRDPDALRGWYADYLGASGQQLIVNYRVRDLDAMLEQLRASGVQVDERVHDMEFGRFGWAVDPEGNRFELWQPA
jgi:glyoxylase I family protein